MLEATGISVRGSERHEIVLPVRVRLATRFGDRVRFRDGVLQEPSILAGDLIDISRGGIGLMLTEFLPKGTRGELRICGLDGDPSRPLLVSKIRVQRSRMTDSRPAYLIGAAFVEIDAVFEHDLESLLHRLRGDEAAPNPPGSTPDLRIAPRAKGGA